MGIPLRGNRAYFIPGHEGRSIGNRIVYGVRDFVGDNLADDVRDNKIYNKKKTNVKKSMKKIIELPERQVGTTGEDVVNHDFSTQSFYVSPSIPSK